jgi:hypothetical protein
MNKKNRVWVSKRALADFDFDKAVQITKLCHLLGFEGKDDFQIKESLIKTAIDCVDELSETVNCCGMGYFEARNDYDYEGDVLLRFIPLEGNGYQDDNT